jgi:hypothetical protein
MMTKRGSTAIQILALAGGILLHAADDPPAPPKVPSQVLAFSELVRAGQVNTPSGNPQLGLFGSPVGSDPLSLGSVEVTRDRRVAIDLQGATANASYAVAFCRFGFAIGAGCVALGQVATNAGGDGTATLTFPSAGSGSDIWNGVFVLTRNAGTVMAEFVSGFNFPPAPPSPATGVQLEITGQIQSISAAAGTLRLAGLPIDISVGPSTKFEGGGIHDLGDLKVGDNVDVDGFTTTNGSIFAVKVKFNRPPNNHDDHD